jgi:hypothetical protein
VTEASSTIDAEPAPGPDWSAVREDIACPLCTYNLRGLIEPRCPECGYRFAWPEVLDPSRRLHPYLFEHHPERNAWSFVRTAVGGLLPRRFWRGLLPSQPSRPRRLLLYALLVLAVHLPVWTYQGVVAAIEYRQSCIADRLLLMAYYLRPNQADRLAGIVRWHGSLSAYMDMVQPVPSYGKALWHALWHGFPFVYSALLASCALGTWLTFATLTIFHTSMRRARVGFVHLLRCALYCGDGIVWLAPMVLLASVTHALVTGSLGLRRSSWAVEDVCVCTLLAFAVVMTYRLGCAFRLYLRFDHPWATVVASQVIVLLVFLNVLLAWTVS